MEGHSDRVQLPEKGLAAVVKGFTENGLPGFYDEIVGRGVEAGRSFQSLGQGTARMRGSGDGGDIWCRE